MSCKGSQYEKSLTEEVWVWLTQLLHAQEVEAHWQLEPLQELTMEGGNQQDGKCKICERPYEQPSAQEQAISKKIVC